LTFTNKAAAEMKSRALRASGLPTRRIQGSTFHTFCSQLLRAHGQLVGVPKEFEILDREDARAIAATVVRPDLADQIMRDWNGHRVRRERVTAVLKQFGTKYQAAKLSQNALDFDDLVVYAADLLTGNGDVATAYGGKFRHILVDEFQDTNAVQIDIIAALAAHATTVSIFADDDQAIFGFAGAESENIDRFVAKMSATKYPLTVNYRSGEKIVALANRLISAAADGSGRTMKAYKGGGEVRFLEFADTILEAKAIAAEIQKGLDAGRKPAEHAVLVRTRYRADLIVDELQRRAIPVSDWRGEAQTPYERRIFAACLATVRGQLSKRQVARLCEVMKTVASNERETHRFLKAHSSQPLAKGLMAMRDLVFNGANAYAVSKAIQQALELQNATLGKSLAGVVEAVSHFQSVDAEFSVEHLLEELALGSAGNAPTEGGGIKVASLHRTKGLQWPTVYLLGLEQGQLPHYKSPTDPEERRLCFVGVSRAQDSLTVTYCKKSGAHRQLPSPFLTEMGLKP